MVPNLLLFLLLIFFISSSSMLSYTIRRIFGIGPYCIASWDVCFASGCFNSYNWSSSSVRDKIPPLILLVNILRAPLTFPFCIWNLDFLDSFTISFGLPSDFSRFSIAFSSSQSSFIFPSFQILNLLLSDFRRSLDLEILLVFYNSKEGTTCKALKSVLLIGAS